MAVRKAHYHLRFQMMPGPDVRERAKGLAAFCVEHDIEEVALFAAGAEPWNDGFVDDGQLDEWCETLKVISDVLRAAGLTVSLNPWYTVGAADRGRHQPSGYAFTPMVSPTGQVARSQASFACPNWQAFVAHLYGRLAEVGFRVVWVEDDFRYHNHAPLEWGGDFSKPMLAHFSAKVGYEVSREEVVASILRPGKPHPWRALWLETWRETQLKVAGIIRDAVISAAPSTRLGLMSSHPSVHSIEGRDWSRLFGAFSSEGQAVHRPHFASYQDSFGSSLARSSFMLDFQKELRAGPLQIEVAPEIENFPMTPYSKSRVVTWGHMALAQLHGSDALLLDLFSFTCQRHEQEPWVGEWLDTFRPGLDALADWFPPTMTTSGVGMLWRPDAALHVHTTRGRDMAELNVPLTAAAEMMQSLGIAVQARPGAVNCLWGAAAWTYSDDELTRFLSGGIWLDAEAVAILQARGFGEYLPVTHGHWWLREDMNYSLEHPESTAAGLDPDTWLSVNAFNRVAFQTLKPGAEEWTSLRDGGGKRIGCAFAMWRNSLGGNVATSALPLAVEPGAYTLSFDRQTLAQRLLTALAGQRAAATMTAGSAYTFPIDLVDGETRRIVLLNASLDPQRPEVLIPAAHAVSESCLLTAEGGPQSLMLHAQLEEEGLRVKVRSEVPFCGVVVLTVQ
ncbi:MAG: hypothetical protein GX601_05070 [Anaerolineales bacterium]|nr:hypothetical protein [Anaerolineales bacterium]